MRDSPPTPHQAIVAACGFHCIAGTKPVSGRPLREGVTQDAARYAAAVVKRNGRGLSMPNIISRIRARGRSARHILPCVGRRDHRNEGRRLGTRQR